MFVYQPTLDALELKKDKSSDYALSWKSKGVFNSKLKPLYTAFLHSMKLSEYRTGIKFDKDPVAAEQNNYLTKIENVYIVYDLDACPRNPTNSFKFNSCLFGATNIVKNIDKEKYIYSGYGITFDSAGSWSFCNDLIIVHHLLGEGPTYGINGSSDHQKKSLVLILVKQTQNFV